MIRAGYILLIFFLHSGLTKICAQLPGIKEFSIQGSSPGISFTSVHHSAHGFIYTGTTKGLYQFNGHFFSPLNTADTITAIAEDNNKQLWVGFFSGRIAKLVNNQFIYFEPEEGLSKKPVNSIAFDKKNNLWFAIAGEGIYYTLNDHLYLVNEENGLNDLNVTRLYLTEQAKILAASDQGFFICDANEPKKKLVEVTPKNGLPDYIVTAFEKLNNNSYFIGLQDKGFCIYNMVTGAIVIPVKNWQWGEVTALKYANGTLWVATKESGLIQIDNIEGNAPLAKSVSPVLGALGMITDAEENLWIITKEKLIKTYGSKLCLLPLYDGKTFETIHAILSTKGNALWAGTDGGLIKYEMKNGQYHPQKIAIAGLSNKIDVTSICEDAYNNLWVGTFGKGVFVLNPKTGAYRSITENPLLKNASILSVTSSGNTVCAGGLEGRATIFELDEFNETIDHTYQYTNYNNIQNIGNNYIYTIYKDSRGRIWFGTNAVGISVLQNEKFTHYNLQNGLDAKNVLAFTEDKKGDIWFCTEENGVYRFDGKKFKHFTMEQGLSAHTITNIKTDRNGNIIVAHKNGFDIINSLTGRITYLNRQQGIPELSIDVGTVATNGDGSITAVSKDGFICYIPPSQKAANNPVAVIESVLLHLKPVNNLSHHEFKHDENNLTFNYIGLWNTGPEMVQYQYKLQGYDSNWVSTSDRSKSFAQLEPGKYEFKVRASLNKDFTNAPESTYSFIIKKAIWKRWWFILLCVLSSAGLMYWYIKSREKEIKKMQQLENEKIGFQFQVLRNQVNPHFLFNSFNTLISTIEEDPKVAVDYVENLSGFFRNIVNYRDKEIITLKEELEVLQTYVYLQQKRYGKNLRINIHPEVTLKSDRFIPPLTLQLLFENAIKHNAIAADTPLSIDITSDGDTLTVVNNINPKTVVETSSGMGLQNITNRYAMLSDKKIAVEKNNKYFSITLPLLKQ